MAVGSLHSLRPAGALNVTTVVADGTSYAASAKGEAVNVVGLNLFAMEIVLPAVPKTGLEWLVKAADGTGGLPNNITISTAGAELIDGDPFVIIGGDWDSLSFYSDGVDYFIG